MTLIRLGVGAVFIRTGYVKITGLDMVEGFFSNLGIPAPAAFALLVAVAELFGGIGILLGILPRFAAATLSVVMLTAIGLATWPGGGWDRSRLELLLLACTLTIVLWGAGRYNLPDMLGKAQLDPERIVIAKLKQPKQAAA